MKCCSHRIARHSRPSSLPPKCPAGCTWPSYPAAWRKPDRCVAQAVDHTPRAYVDIRTQTACSSNAQTRRSSEIFQPDIGAALRFSRFPLLRRASQSLRLLQLCAQDALRAYYLRGNEWVLACQLPLSCNELRDVCSGTLLRSVMRNSERDS